MTQIAFTIFILFGVYFFGYFVGRKQILDEIKAYLRSWRRRNMMPLKCRGCKHYCLTQYKPEYHGMVEGCAAGKTNTKYPYCYTKKEEIADGSVGCVQ